MTTDSINQHGEFTAEHLARLYPNDLVIDVSGYSAKLYIETSPYAVRVLHGGKTYRLVETTT